MGETRALARARAIAASLILAAAPIAAAAEDARGGIVYGELWAFMAMAPEGWTWDPVTMRNRGLQGLYYKAGTVFSPESLHMYVSPSPKAPASPRGLAEFIAADEALFRKQYPGISVKRLPPRETGPGYSFARVELDDAARGYYQELAYYEGEACYFVIVLTCRSAEERAREIPAFDELVDSFTCVDAE